MAVMGPSGCGKTTLLSLLAKRKMDLSFKNICGGPQQSGEITVNDETYTSYDYSQFGAFV